MSARRQFRQSAADSRNSVRELLQIIFTAELLSSSRCLWIVSPWLRDIPVLDNHNSLSVARPENPFRKILLK